MALLGIVLVLGVAGGLGRAARGVADEPPWSLSPVGRARPADNGLLLGEPLLSRPIDSGGAAPVVLVAQLQEDASSAPGGGSGSPGDTVGSDFVVSGNPGASNTLVGSGWLGDYLGINRNGFRVAGLNITDANGLSGGLVPGWTGDSLTIVDFSLDTDKAFGWSNGLIGSELLYYSGGRVNTNAGTVMGYNSLDDNQITFRAEIFTLWYLHKFANDRLLIRIGKSITTYDFANVIQANAYDDEAHTIPAVSSLIFTPLYINPTVLGIWPGYLNSATGVVSTLIPVERTYFKYGLYDGNLANGRQVGTEGPRFNGYNLHIAELGASWQIGPDKKPGKFGFGYWSQTGVLEAASGPVDGAQGIYLFGSQRLTYERAGESSEGLSVFYQFSGTNTPFVETHRYFGCGLTYYGLLPGRDRDSVGWGMAYGRMNNDPALDLGADEVILSWYYQWIVRPNFVVQPNITYIPNPATAPDNPSALPVTLRAILLF